jgi:hypothetical protein
MTGKNLPKDAVLEIRGTEGVKTKEIKNAARTKPAVSHSLK